MRRFALLLFRSLCWLVCLGTAAAAFATESAGPTAVGTWQYRLKNGMKVIVKPDQRAPTVVHMVWYQAGSIDEFNGTTGVAHVLEHMMFKGTKTVKVGEFSRRVASMGGRENAFTGQDYTAYFQQIHRRYLPQVMALEADRMTNLVLSEKEFTQEIKVVMEERRWRTDDKPTSQVYEAVLASAFQASPYHHPVIGWMNDLENLTYQDARSWYQRWYVPNNAILIVVGDVVPDDVYKLAQQTYGKARARPLPVRKPQIEPEQMGMRRLSIKAPAENAYVMLAWKAPALRDLEKDDEVYALSVLAAVLDGYPGARLNAQLVRADKIALQAGASFDATARGPALFYLDATPAPGQTTAILEQALRAQIRQVAEQGVSAAELLRVKAQLIASQVYKQDSIMGQAMEMAQLEMVNLPHTARDRLIEKIRAVTAEQVQAVAQKYFGDDTLTVGELMPQPLDPNKPKVKERAEFRH